MHEQTKQEFSRTSPNTVTYEIRWGWAALFGLGALPKYTLVKMNK